MGRMTSRAPVAVVLAAALVAGLLGPCLCAAPAPEAAAADSHGCCGPEAGIMAASECCACAAVRAAAPTMTAPESALSLVPASACVAIPPIRAATLHRFAVPPQTAFDTSPPTTVLRI